jgi:hypothetical protein
VKGDEMKTKRRTTFLSALLLAAIAGLGVASAQLPTRNLPMGAPAAENSEGEECLSGIAINATLGMFCSDFCTDDSGCPTSWGCREIDQPNGVKVGICFPYRHVATP